VVQTGVDRYELRARQEGIEIVLDMVDLKGPVLHGEQGYSQNGPSQGNASYYISQTRLRSTGTIRIENTSFQVSGLSWMDHEFSTSALSEGQVGWDWFSIQLDNETELMVFQIRREDGTVDSYSSGTIIQPDATTLHLTGEEFTILVEDTWTSPSSGAEYPANWKVTIPLYGIQLEITPYLADQEMQVNFTYWEGCVFIEGEFQGEKVSGAGYVEMTGYTESMEGEF
jgi:predicted secreted hydrolase